MLLPLSESMSVQTAIAFQESKRIAKSKYLHYFRIKGNPPRLVTQAPDKLYYSGNGFVKMDFFVDKKGLLKKTAPEELIKMHKSFGSMPESNQCRTGLYR